MDTQNRNFNFNKPWLNSQEAAAYLCVTPASLRNMTSAGRIPYHKLNGCRRGRNIYKRQELDQLFSIKLGGYRCDNQT